MIKNWTVTAQSVKSSSAREIYLNDEKHANHKHTEAILNVIGNEQTTLNINRNMEAYKLESSKKRKGGRPPTPAMEFVFSLPKRDDLRPTPEQWKRIIFTVVSDMAKSMKIEAKELSGIVRAVAHKQEQNAKKGSGDHCHVVIGKFTNSGVYLRDLQKKGVLFTAKQSFNKAVFDTLGVDHATYQAESSFNAKKRAPQWQVHAARTHEELKIKSDAISRDSELIEKERRALIKLKNQADKWLQARKDGDQKQENRQKNRIQKTVNELAGFEATSDSMEFADNLIKFINEKEPEAVKKEDKKELPSSLRLGR